MSENRKDKERLESSIRDSDSAVLLEYLKDSAMKHEHYRYYSSQKTVDKIVGTQSLILSRGDNWNDLEDRMAFSSSLPGYTRFGTCLSFMRTESIAMWMLYGGVDGKGAMVDLTKANMLGCLEAAREIQLGRIGEGGFEEVQTVGEGGFDLYLLDILYYGEGRGRHKAKRGPSVTEQLDGIPSGPGILIKSLPWSYENEVRVVLDVPEGIVKDDAHVARLPLAMTEEQVKGRTYLAPTNPGQKYRRSALRGKVSWDLCGDCSHKQGSRP